MKEKKIDMTNPIPIVGRVGDGNFSLKKQVKNIDDCNNDLQDDKAKNDYRNLLISLITKSEESYDKAVLTLSGGALGISFAFLNGIIETRPIISPKLLVSSWFLWSISVVFILSSFFSSGKSLRSTVAKLDSGQQECIKGLWTTVTFVLNVLSGLLFIAGVIVFSLFVYKNVR